MRKLSHQYLTKLWHQWRGFFSETKFSKSKTAAVILVGGSSKIPKIKALLKSFFPSTEVLNKINSDETVAIGAAYRAASLSSLQNPVDFFLQDVTPLSYGTSVVGDKMSVIVKKNSRIPIRMTETYYTVKDNQKKMIIDVFQGEDKTASNNFLVGEYTLSGLTELPKGEVAVEITFSLGSDNLLEVTAKERKAGGASCSLTLNVANGRLALDQIRKLRDENGVLTSSPKKIPAKNQIFGLD